MNFLTFIKNSLKKLFDDKPAETASSETLSAPIIEFDASPNELAKQLEEIEQDIAKFKLENVVFDKLNYLEQYIKIFASSFPKEYNEYLSLIYTQKKEYEQELESYRAGLAGSITFSIDPECESKRLLAAIELEKQITYFVDFVVSYNTYKDKFSILCNKLNHFYNMLVNHRMDSARVRRQFENATNTATNLIDQVKGLVFFEQDSRLREDILNYVIYCDYLLFKIALRNNLCCDLLGYKRGLSKLHKLFVDTEYDRLIFKFFIQDLELIQGFIVSNLQDYECSDYMLDSCTRLQSKMKDFLNVSLGPTYFEETLKLENTLEESAKTFGLDFVIVMPDSLDADNDLQDENVNNIAISVLKLINAGKARLLLEIVKSFTLEISWKDFYFLCKVFELYREVIEVSKSTVFSSVEANFLRLDKKYPEYSSARIAEKKTRLLNYNGSKKKKYVLLFPKEYVDCNFVIRELEALSLDFVVAEDAIYLNHSYFNGFTTLERIFGNFITF